MGGYLSSRKLTNVKGRISYITNEKKQENIIDYHNTTDSEFWKMLAKENQERHETVKAGGKCCEARELIIGIPQNSNVTAQQLCDNFKNKYGVECACAIHQNNKNGIVNRHCHLIFSERQKLNTPEVTEEKRATRTYYYDEKGRKCKKADAVKTVKKGTLLQKGLTRNFSDKNEFFKSQKFIYECKELFLNKLLEIDWSFENEKLNKELSEKHIGKNNPKAMYIQRNNELKSMVKDVCKASDFVIAKERGMALKELKKGYDIKDFSAINYEENKHKVYSFVKEMQSLYKSGIRNEIKGYNYINQDVNLLHEEDYTFKPVQAQIISDYESQTKTRNKFKVIEFLKEKLSNMFKRIEKLIDIQNLLYIEPKNKIEIYQDKRNHAIHIENSAEDYIREQKERNEQDFEM